MDWEVAQGVTYQLSPVVLRGSSSDRAMPMLEKGLPTCARANCSIRCSWARLQPSERYWLAANTQGRRLKRRMDACNVQWRTWVLPGALRHLRAVLIVEDARDVGHHAILSCRFADGNLHVRVRAHLRGGGQQVERGLSPPPGKQKRTRQNTCRYWLKSV